MDLQPASLTPPSSLTVRPLRRQFISPLTTRILAVNILALVMLAGGVLYLDEFRIRLIEQRRAELATQARLMADALAELAIEQPLDPFLNSARANSLVQELADETPARVRVISHDMQVLSDSNLLLPGRGVQPFRLEDEPWRRRAARWLDRVIEALGSAPSLEPYVNVPASQLPQLREVRLATLGKGASELRRSDEGITVVSVAEPIQRLQKVVGVVLLTADTRDIRRVVRAERLASFQIFCLVFALTLLLSIFLARTIARPIRRLAVAADRVRLGRARDVAVPRLPKRRDEIGHLARVLSDMTQALYSRMDAIEAFAADVSHEIKNPLSSLRSAVESLAKIKDAALQERLLTIIRDDVVRLDRLITDISDASRLDAELSRERFEPVDLGEMIATLIEVYSIAGIDREISIALAKPPPKTAMTMGLETRLSQVVRNLIDNAISFSPVSGVVRVMLTVDRVALRLIVDDDGPGIPDGNIEDIFKRFYSERPDREDFGQHSGLGLAISKQVVEAHGGRIQAQNRVIGGKVAGARFVVELPVAKTHG